MSGVRVIVSHELLPRATLIHLNEKPDPDRLSLDSKPPWSRLEHGKRT